MGDDVAMSPTVLTDVATWAEGWGGGCLVITLEDILSQTLIPGDRGLVMTSPRTVFDVLSEVIKRNPGLSQCSLAEHLVRGVYDPGASDPDLVNFLIRCENILNAAGSPELRNSAMTIVWLDTTLPAVIGAVALWAEREFKALNRFSLGWSSRT